MNALACSRQCKCRTCQNVIEDSQQQDQFPYSRYVGGPSVVLEILECQASNLHRNRLQQLTPRFAFVDERFNASPP
jgi:hypothetical protein